MLEVVAASLGARVGTAAAGMAGLTFSACGDSPTDAPAVVPTFRQSLRVDMRRPDGSLLLSEGALSRIEVHVGSGSTALLPKADRTVGTTHAADAFFSVQGAQSYAVVLRSANGPPVPLPELVRHILHDLGLPADPPHVARARDPTYDDAP